MDFINVKLSKHEFEKITTLLSQVVLDGEVTITPYYRRVLTEVYNKMHSLYPDKWISNNTDSQG